MKWIIKAIAVLTALTIISCSAPTNTEPQLTKNIIVNIESNLPIETLIKVNGDTVVYTNDNSYASKFNVTKGDWIGITATQTKSKFGEASIEFLTTDGELVREPLYFQSQGFEYLKHHDGFRVE